MAVYSDCYQRSVYEDNPSYTTVQWLSSLFNDSIRCNETTASTTKDARPSCASLLQVRERENDFPLVLYEVLIIRADSLNSSFPKSNILYDSLTLLKY